MASPPNSLSPDERAALIAQWEPLIHQMAHRIAPGANADHHDELASEIRFCLVRASHTFDPSRGLKFSTYAFGRMTQYHATYFHRRQLRRGVYLPPHLEFKTTIPGPVSLDHGAGSERDETMADLVLADPPDDVTEYNRDEFWIKIRSLLTRRQYNILRSYYTEYTTLRVIAGRYRLSRERIRQIIKTSIGIIRDGAPELRDIFG